MLPEAIPGKLTEVISGEMPVTTAEEIITNDKNVRGNKPR
jgi:hypothetical protein